MHPREVDAHFSHGSVSNYWGGSSNATTHLLDAMHYRGLLRVARRSGRRPDLRRAHAHDRTTRCGRAARAYRSAGRRHRAQVRAAAGVESVGSCEAVALRGAAMATRPERRVVARQEAARVMPASTASIGIGHAMNRHLLDRVAKTSFVSWRRLIRSYGTAVASRFSGTGRTASRRTRRRPNDSSATTHCRCCGATALSGGAISRSKDGELHTDIGYLKSAPRDRLFKRELDAELDRMRAFLGLASIS